MLRDNKYIAASNAGNKDGGGEGSEGDSERGHGRLLVQLGRSPRSSEAPLLLQRKGYIELQLVLILASSVSMNSGFRLPRRNLVFVLYFLCFARLKPNPKYYCTATATVLL